MMKAATSEEVDAVFEELRSLVGWKVPSRIAVDSVAPFLEVSPTSGSPGPGYAGAAARSHHQGVC